MRRAILLSLCLLLFPLVGQAADLGFGACLTCPSNTPPPTAAGDLLLGNSTPIWTLKAAGAEGTCFRITSGLPEWTACPSGLTGASVNGAVYATGTTTATSTSALANGQILVGRTGLAPIAAAIQGTPNQIAVTLGVGTITVSIPSGPTLPGTTVGTFSGSLTGNASTASAFDHNPIACGANLFVTDQAVDGTLVCTQPTFSNLAGAATAGQLPATVVTSVVNDPNVIGSISAQVLTFGWAGTLPKARIVASAVYNDQVNTFTGSGTLTGLPAPAAASDAATKGYVDTVAVGLSVKTSPRVATTANLTATYVNGASGVGATLTNSGTLAALVVDGVSLASPDRVLVKDQASSVQNGLYTVTTVGSGAVAWVLTRATDYDTAGEVVSGTYTVVTAGTTNTGTMWIMTQSAAITMGTTPIVFTALAVAPQTITLTGAVAGTGTSTIATTLALVAPTLGGTGATNTATSGRYLKGDGTNFVTSVGSASGVGTCTNQFARVLNSDAPPACASVSLGTDVTGTLLAASFPALAGDVTVTAGSLTTVLTNIPTATQMTGSLLATAIIAPGTPAAGKASLYVDSTSKNLTVKDDAGVVKHGVQTNTGASDNFLTAISDAGVVSRAQPSFSNISSTLLTTQMVALTGDITNTTGTVTTTIVAGAVTLAKMANLATARLIGRTTAGTGVPEALSVVPTAVFPALTGDVTTPGGSLTTTLTNVPTGTPHAGSDLYTMITAPGTPAIGKASVYVDSTSKNLAVKDDSGLVKHGVQTITCSGQFISAINDAGLPTCATPAGGGNVSNTGTPASGQLAIWFSSTVIQGLTALPAANFPALVGDVTTAAGSLTVTLANLPTGVPMAGSLLAAAITAPGTPAVGKGSVYVDSTSKNFAVKDDAGVVKHGVRTDTGASNNFLTAIADDGTVSKAQPSFTNIASTLLTTQMVALTGDVTNAVGTVNTTIAAGIVTLAKMANMATASFLGRNTAATGIPEVLSIATAKTMLGLTGTNSGDQTITLTSDVTGSGTGSFATTIANNAVTLAKMATMATASFLGRNTAATGLPEVLSIATAKTMLGLTGTNSGDQTITLTSDVTGSGTGSFAVTLATPLRTRSCVIVVGAENGAALVDADLGPQLHQCTIDVPMTVQEIRISADGGTPSVIVQKRTITGAATALLSGALATAAAGAVSCAKTTAVTSYDGSTTCASTLQNNISLTPGMTLGLTSGSASSAKRASVVVTMTVD
jgi:hypothetical protein